jgi:subtilisin family serine protease
VWVFFAAVLAVFSPTARVWGQDAAPAYHYYYFDQKRPLTLDTRRIAVLEYGNTAGTVTSLGGARRALTRLGVRSTSVRPHPIKGWSVADTPARLRTAKGVEALADQVADRVQAPGNRAAAPEPDFVSPIFLDEADAPVLITPDILVGFHDGVAPEQAERILRASGAGVIRERDWNDMPGVYRLRSGAKSGFDTLDAANALAERPEVSFAEPDRIVTGQAEFLPNDALFAQQWGLHNTGQSGGAPDSDMDGPEAWDITTGDSSVLVVVLDTGVQQDHPDINQAPGRDFTTNGGDGGPVNQYDNHGTNVAGCVSAIINNNRGVAGIAPNCRVASARVGIALDGAGRLNVQTTWIVNALTWAQQIGARVTNASFSSGGPFSALDAKYAQTYNNNGMVHFAASGNGGGTISYPARSPSVNAVGAIDRNGARASFSQYGTGLDFVAPGAQIVTTDRTGPAGYSSSDYRSATGTSFASPYAAGVAALVLSVNPALSASEVEAILQAGCEDLGQGGYDTVYGHGLVNAYTAVSRVAAVPVVPSALTLDPSSITGGGASTATVMLSGPAPAGGAEVSLSSGDSAVASVPDSVTVAEGETHATFSVATSGVAATTPVTITAACNGSSQEATLTVEAEPVTLTALSVDPTTVTGGDPCTGVITLSGPAPAGGVQVWLFSSDPDAAGVSDSVTVAEGETSATFAVISSAVQASTPLVITAAYNGSFQEAALAVEPVP